MIELSTRLHQTAEMLRAGELEPEAGSVKWVPGITCACNKCPHMARNTLEKVRDCMIRGEPVRPAFLGPPRSVDSHL